MLVEILGQVGESTTFSGKRALNLLLRQLWTHFVVVGKMRVMDQAALSQLAQQSCALREKRFVIDARD